MSDRLCGYTCRIPESDHHTEEHPFLAFGDARRLAAGISAGVSLRLLAGRTDQTYTPTEVAELVSLVGNEQLRRLGLGLDAIADALPEPA